jgi:hypothetical protein
VVVVHLSPRTLDSCRIKIEATGVRSYAPRYCSAGIFLGVDGWHELEGIFSGL